MANDYGKQVVYSGPLFKAIKIEGDKIRVSFDHVGGGLITGKKEGLKPTQEVSGAELARFAIQDDQGAWHWAKAVIDGETVVVSQEGVTSPVAVRYAYESNPVGVQWSRN